MNVSRPGSWHISSIEPLDAESGILDQFLDRAIQVTAAGQVLPGWGEMILPPAHTRLWRAPMLDKQKTTSRFQYPQSGWKRRVKRRKFLIAYSANAGGA
jgi:hypothetical protein